MKMLEGGSAKFVVSTEFNRPDLDNRANHPEAIKNQLRSDKVTQSHKLRSA